jgi:predicted ATPase/DNA-binding SARP family transcriptional activator
MEFRILGPLEALDEGRDVAPPGSKRRALLALLLLHANETLPVERLIDELWGENPPVTAAKALQVHVSRLRKALGAGNGADGVIVTRGHGYQLRVDPERLDAHRFERLIAEGSGELAAGRPARAASAFESALTLWRGAPLADLLDEPFAGRETARLEDLRLAAVEQLNDAKLQLGRHAELIGQLEALIGEHPYREGLRAQLMLALYRSERQADALQAYQDARRTLVEELGIEPGERLRELERAILAQDPSLALVAVESAEPAPSRLPVPPSHTLGRDQDRQDVVALVRRPDVRLVTLTGAGGVGKTRLALEVARRLETEFDDGAWFVSLAATANAEHVSSAITQALGVKPLEGETSKEAVERYLAHKRGLLVLDNFEHLLAAAPLVSDLLAGSSGVVVLATSRKPLRLQTERCYAVAPLQVPVNGDPVAVERAAAGALFVERARSHDRDFALTDDNAGVIAKICRRLDGLPLAIELAAARTTVLDADQLNTRLARALDVLGGGTRDSPDRQRTLRATIDWSHRLLSTAEARTFARFAVFSGGATIEAAEAVTAANLDVLQGLVDKHLLLRRSDSRLWMLETVREVAREQLDTEPYAGRARERHCRHYLALAERAEPQLFTRTEAVWLPRLDAEVDNFRAALDWSLAREPALALRLAGLLYLFWEVSNRDAEGLEWVEAALDAAGDDAPVRDRARALRARVYLLAHRGVAYDWQGSMDEARSAAIDALALSRQGGDPGDVAEALLLLGDFDMANSLPQRRRRELADEALPLARESGDERLVAYALRERALTVAPEQGAAELDEAVAMLRKIGGTRQLLWLYSDTAYNAIKRGRPELARPMLESALALAHELGDPHQLAFVYGNVGLEALFTGDLERAHTAFHDQVRLCREHVLRVGAEGLSGLAAIEARRGGLERAARLLGAASAVGPWDRDVDVAAHLEKRFFAPARAQHGAQAWNAAHAEGAQMSFDQALAFGLSPPWTGLTRVPPTASPRA